MLGGFQLEGSGMGLGQGGVVCLVCGLFVVFCFLNLPLLLKGCVCWGWWNRNFCPVL